MRRLMLIVALLVIFPIMEIAVLIAIGQVIGAAWTLLLVLATSALGGWLLRREGSRAWRAFQADIAQNRPPGNTATEGVLVLIGGIFMLVPGFVSDIIGAILILPPTRRIARRIVLVAITSRMSAATVTSLFGPRRVRARFGQPHSPTYTAGPSEGPSTGASTYPASAYPESAQGPDGSRPSGASDAIEGEIIDPH
jgi:UPF0716 protein FxsA